MGMITFRDFFCLSIVIDSNIQEGLSWYQQIEHCCVGTSRRVGACDFHP